MMAAQTIILSWHFPLLLLLVSCMFMEHVEAFQFINHSRSSSFTTPSIKTYALTRRQKQKKFRIPTATPTTSTTCLLMAMTQYDRCDVAIFGGGFGGLYSALAIAEKMKRSQQSKIDIVLIDPSDQFVFLPLLYDLVVGTASQQEVCPPYEELLEGTGIRHIKASLDSFSVNTVESDDKSQDFSAVLKDCSSTISLKNDNKDEKDDITLSFQSSVIAVGATPQSILEKIPGALQYAQPFYTQQDAYDTRDLLFRIDQKIRQQENDASIISNPPQVAVVGGGYGGVELSACLARRLPKAQVTLISRGPPMKGTRAETLVDQALAKLGVTVEYSSVEEIIPVDNDNKDNDASTTITKQVMIRRSSMDESSDKNVVIDSDKIWDAVFWTAGSSAAYPVPGNISGLAVTTSGRLMVDDTLRCNWSGDIATKMDSVPSIFALGDCSEIVPTAQPAVPKTAQAAIQQADTVAFNVVSDIENGGRTKAFRFQDLGTALSLGGPNGAILGPSEDSQLGPLLVPLLDTARVGLSIGDRIFANIINSPTVDKKSALVVQNLNLSLGGYGLGVNPEETPGALSGTLSGISRRAIYALRMPTNRQRAYAAASSFLSSAAVLAKEAADQIQKTED